MNLLTETDEFPVPARGEMERRRVSLKDAALILVLLTNFGGLVWGAAQMANSVSKLDDSVKDLRQTAAALTSQLNAIQFDYGARIRVLEDRLSRKEQSNGGSTPP